MECGIVKQAFRDKASFISKKHQELQDRINASSKVLNDVKNEKLACLEIRNHIAWYFKGIKGCNELKNKVYQTSNIRDIIMLLNEFKKEVIDDEK